MPRHPFLRLAVLATMLSAYASFGVVLGMIFVLLTKTIDFFRKVPISRVFLDWQWSLQENRFSLYPLLLGTMLIVAVALVISVPIALTASVCMSEYVSKKCSYRIRPFLEVAAGVPTVVYGFLAVAFIGPTVKNAAEFMGFRASSESALVAGTTMALMLIPFMVSLFSDVLQAVPQTLRDGARALGSTKFETVWHIVLPAAFSGMLGAVLLTISRGIGETMIVVMAAGLTANLTVMPLDAVTTVTVQIVSLLLGDQDYADPKVLAAFMIGFFLFLFTLAFNAAALSLMKRERMSYE